MAICLDFYRKCMTRKNATVLIMLKEKWKIISCRISITNIVNDLRAFSIKMDAFLS